MKKMSVQAAVENLYDAFSGVARPNVIDVSPVCNDDKGAAIMLSTYLRNLTPDELSSYSASAFLTVGDVADYMHFLPRIIEISVTEDCWWPDIEVQTIQASMCSDECVCSLFSRRKVPAENNRDQKE